jgi:hypothetical protein
MRQSLVNKSGTATAVRILQISRLLRQQPIVGYATALVAIGLATLVQWLGRGQYDDAAFLTIYPAVILTTLVGGLGAGFLSALVAGLSQWGLFIPTLHWLAVTSYTLDATVCVLLIVFINRTLDLLLSDIDQEKQAKQNQFLLAAELHHRIQNLFTVIQAIIRFSLPGEKMVQQSEIKERLMDRLQSMSATNRAITDSMGDGVRLLDLIKGGITGFESQFEISGAPGLVLGPQMTQNFSLILHELLTNALKQWRPVGTARPRQVGAKLDVVSADIRVGRKRRTGGVAAGRHRLRQPHPRRFRQKLLRECRSELRSGWFSLHVTNSFRPEPVCGIELGFGNGFECKTKRRPSFRSRMAR